MISWFNNLADRKRVAHFYEIMVSRCRGNITCLIEKGIPAEVNYVILGMVKDGRRLAKAAGNVEREPQDDP